MARDTQIEYLDDDEEQQPETSTEAVTVTAELAAMRKLCAALEPLDNDARRRVLTWLTGRYGMTGGAS